MLWLCVCVVQAVKTPPLVCCYPNLLLHSEKDLKWKTRIKDRNFSCISQRLFTAPGCARVHEWLSGRERATASQVDVSYDFVSYKSVSGSGEIRREKKSRVRFLGGAVFAPLLLAPEPLSCWRLSLSLSL